jgi:hypothetical protein
MKFSKSWTAAVALVTLTGVAQASLVNRGGGMIYDTTLNLTWLADMNYAKTSGYVAGGVDPGSDHDDNNIIYTDGRMGWFAATRWANNLVFGGFDDWRLPTLNAGDTSCSNNFNWGLGQGVQYLGYHCTGGEMSHLFVTDLGNKAAESVLTQTGDTAEQIANLALFAHVHAGRYWSGLGYGGQGYAWLFDTYNGYQGIDNSEYGGSYALAVRSGDVAATVPEPQTCALVMLAFGAPTWLRRKQPA